MFAFIAPILLFVAFLLLLLVSLSLPIIKSIFLFKLSAHISSVLSSSASGDVTFGVWGYCVSTLSVSVAGLHDSQAGQCTKPHLGYTFDSTVASALHVDHFTNIITHASTAALVFHPIACALTFVAFVVSLFILHRGTNGTARLPSVLTLVFGILSAMLTSIVFLIDVIVIAVVRSRVHKDTHGDITLVWGNATWMVLGAAIATWIAMCGACAGVVGFRGLRRQRKTETY